MSMKASGLEEMETDVTAAVLLNLIDEEACNVFQ